MDEPKFRRIWPAIISALEREIPFYDGVGEWISLGFAAKARKYAAEKGKLHNGVKVLDVGLGTGLMSAAILSVCEPSVHVGLDYSLHMMRATVDRVKDASKIWRVRGVFEALPLSNNSFDRVYSSFALEDTGEKTLMLKELRRVCRVGGLIVIVNMGKPDALLPRLMTSFYIRRIMPFIAKMVVLRRLRGNPWRLLIPVYEHLPTNNQLASHLQSIFGNVILKHYLLGGVLVSICRKQG